MRKNKLNESSFLNVMKSIDKEDIKLRIITKKNWKLLNLIFLLIIIFLIISILFYFCYILFIIKNQMKANEIIIKNITNTNINIEDNIIEPYIKAQKDFCSNPNKYFNEEYEKDIKLVNVKLNELKYQMYLFKYRNFLLNDIKKKGAFEIDICNSILEALKFYSSKNKIINNKDIFILDIGGNVGWYPSYLGRYGYTILSFEPFERNNYVAKKNYCNIKEGSNIIIITKGLGSEKKICDYFIHKKNEGNGMVKCDNKNYLNNTSLRDHFIKESIVEITTLNSFIPYLFTKNVALMKIDVEGNELHVIKGGEKLITKYHIPFVVLEFSPTFLKEAGSEPKKLAQFFVDNGYKISLKGFMSKDYISVDEIMKKVRFQINCYFIHDSIK